MRKRQLTSRQPRTHSAGGDTERAQRSLLQRLLHEPLLHFLLLGAVIFAIWTLLHPAAPGSDIHISINAADVQRMKVQATRQWGREPEPAMVAALVEADIREQVLYREALALGLDRDDVVIRRRLVQKLESLAQDPLPEPDEATLQAYWQQHVAGKPGAATLTLQQISFSSALHGAKAADAARAALVRLEKGEDAGAGDPFLLPARAEQQTQATLARDYGAAFAQQVFALPVGRWQGPITSSLGLHLVRISDRVAPAKRTYAADREQVKQDYARQALSTAQESAYQKIRARYQIRIAPGALPAAGARQ